MPRSRPTTAVSERAERNKFVPGVGSYKELESAYT